MSNTPENAPSKKRRIDQDDESDHDPKRRRVNLDAEDRSDNEGVNFLKTITQNSQNDGALAKKKRVDENPEKGRTSHQATREDGDGQPPDPMDQDGNNGDNGNNNNNNNNNNNMSGKRPSLIISKKVPKTSVNVTKNTARETGSSHDTADNANASQVVKDAYYKVLQSLGFTQASLKTPSRIYRHLFLIQKGLVNGKSVVPDMHLLYYAPHLKFAGVPSWKRYMQEVCNKNYLMCLDALPSDMLPEKVQELINTDSVKLNKALWDERRSAGERSTPHSYEQISNKSWFHRFVYSYLVKEEAETLENPVNKFEDLLSFLTEHWPKMAIMDKSVPKLDDYLVNWISHWSEDDKRDDLARLRVSKNSSSSVENELYEMYRN